VPLPPPALLPYVGVCRFGDIGPVSNLARAASLCILVPLFFVLLQQVNELSEIYGSQSKYGTPFMGSPHGHVIVCGQLHVRTLRAGAPPPAPLLPAVGSHLTAGTGPCLAEPCAGGLTLGGRCAAGGWGSRVCG
jgi:hypothetical protein